MRTVHLYCAECTRANSIVLKVRLKKYQNRQTDHETQSVVSSRPSGQQQRKPDGRMSFTASVVQSADSGWLIAGVGCWVSGRYVHSIQAVVGR